LGADRFAEVPEHSHVFLTALKRCAVKGVYILRNEVDGGATSATPVVYIAEAASDSNADEIHRQVWNQNVVPFLIVRTPQGIRLYSGFAYGAKTGSEGSQGGVLETAIRFEDAILRLAAFRATSIDDGTLWRELGDKVTPDCRVDRKLLNNLEALGQWLHQQGVGRETAHALIGKLVYLRYLRDRRILSDRRLAAWKIEPDEVFGRRPELQKIQLLVGHLDEWLNGQIFPLALSGRGELKKKHIERAASVFLGDDVHSGQFHLDFQAYDFSYIPIETLSTIYEQFLAIEGRSRQTGAYYTPVSLVSFMLNELEDYRPLQRGMRILDPACGSGAFLVQCYRRLIEKEIREQGRALRPTELRDLLVQQIFGVDRDLDACRVTEMSLILTMLDYMNPPDLWSTKFKLPCLHNTNIYQSDFFDSESIWACSAGLRRYDWVVGNPPWVAARADSEETKRVRRWMEVHEADYPVGGYQVAEAFAWEASNYVVRDNGIVGLLLPAMTLFRANPKRQSGFRERFFGGMQVRAVANFANLREVLFAGRARLPSVALFYYPTSKSDVSQTASTLVYSPLVINQEANRPTRGDRRKPVWGITVNSSEVCVFDKADISSGSSVLWKMALWGGVRDKRLIDAASRRFPSLQDFGIEKNFAMHQGLELRAGPQVDLEAVPEVTGKRKLLPQKIADVGRLHFIPDRAVEIVGIKDAYARRGRKQVPLKVCFAPHVVLSAARNFAIFCDDFLVIPDRQIGIAGPEESKPILKALSLFLSSDFATYHEFFISPQWGVRDGRSTLDTLKRLPIPLAELTDGELREWCELHGDLVAVSKKSFKEGVSRNRLLFDESPEAGSLADLNLELNKKVEAALGLSESEHWLVHDLVHIKMHLTDGKLGEPAVRPPSREDLEGYAMMLRQELDAYLDTPEAGSHRVRVWMGRNSGAVEIELLRQRKETDHEIEIHDDQSEISRRLERLRHDHEHISRQWLYFDRNLFVYDRDRTLIFKPSQRFWWTRSQAMSDADEIIAAALAPQDRE
jgi:methylase of polypeptide subunit release factors